MEHIIWCQAKKHMINRIYGGSTTSVTLAQKHRICSSSMSPKKHINKLKLQGSKKLPTPKQCAIIREIPPKKTYICIVWPPQLNLSHLMIADQRSQPPSAYAKNLSSALWISRSVCALENGGKSNCSPKKCPKNTEICQVCWLEGIYFKGSLSNTFWNFENSRNIRKNMLENMGVPPITHTVTSMRLPSFCFSLYNNVPRHFLGNKLSGWQDLNMNQRRIKTSQLITSVSFSEANDLQYVETARKTWLGKAWINTVCILSVHYIL